MLLQKVRRALVLGSCIVFLTGAVVLTGDAAQGADKAVPAVKSGTVDTPAKGGGDSMKAASDNAKKTASDVAPPVKGAKININTADAKGLQEIKGIGPVTAEAIVAYRKANGKFKTAEDLLKVKGIGEKTLAEIKPQISF